MDEMAEVIRTANKQAAWERLRGAAEAVSGALMFPQPGFVAWVNRLDSAQRQASAAAAEIGLPYAGLTGIPSPEETLARYVAVREELSAERKSHADHQPDAELWQVVEEDDKRFDAVMGVLSATPRLPEDVRELAKAEHKAWVEEVKRPAFARRHERAQRLAKLESEFRTAALALAEAAAPAQPLARERAVEVLGAFASEFTADEIDGFLVTAHADPHEGADWLPYYKLAIGIQCGVMGYLSALVLRLMEDQPKERVLNYLIALRKADRERAAAMMPCGIGPRTDAETVSRITAKCMRIAAGRDDG